MPWKMVTRNGTNMTLKEADDRILNKKKSERKELERRHEAHMKEETERLNELVDWYKLKLNEKSEALVDSRP